MPVAFTATTPEELGTAFRCVCEAPGIPATPLERPADPEDGSKLDRWPYSFAAFPEDPCGAV